MYLGVSIQVWRPGIDNFFNALISPHTYILDMLMSCVIVIKSLNEPVHWCLITEPETTYIEAKWERRATLSSLFVSRTRQIWRWRYSVSSYKMSWISLEYVFPMCSDIRHKNTELNELLPSWCAYAYCTFTAFRELLLFSHELIMHCIITAGYQKWSMIWRSTQTPPMCSMVEFQQS